MTDIVETVDAAGKYVALPMSNLAQVFGYTGGLLTTITVVYAGTTYIQTLTYSGNNVINTSRFIAQA
jgi:hypothetical protein